MSCGRRARIVTLVAAASLMAADLALLSARDSARAVRPVDPEAICRMERGRTRPVAMSIPGDGERTARVRVPRDAPRRMPLVIALHGAYTDGAFMESYSGLSRIADRAGFAIVYPDALAQRRRWRLSGREGDADVRFLQALIDRIRAGGCVDPRRVSVVGVSNGGGMAARMACADAGGLAGVVSVAGDYGDLPECGSGPPVAVLEIHGTADAVVPYRPSSPDARGDVRAWLAGWAARDRCRGRPRRRTISTLVVRLDWWGCRSGAAVSHLRIAGGGHQWPGADPPDPGPVSGISAAVEAWRFLAGRRVAAGDEGGREGRDRARG